MSACLESWVGEAFIFCSSLSLYVVEKKLCINSDYICLSYHRFMHPHTGKELHFSCMPPADFAEVLSGLRSVNTEKVSHKVILLCTHKLSATPFCNFF